MCELHRNTTALHELFIRAAVTGSCISAADCSKRRETACGIITVFLWHGVYLFVCSCWRFGSSWLGSLTVLWRCFPWGEVKTHTNTWRVWPAAQFPLKINFFLSPSFILSGWFPFWNLSKQSRWDERGVNNKNVVGVAFNCYLVLKAGATSKRRLDYESIQLAKNPIPSLQTAPGKQIFMTATDSGFSKTVCVRASDSLIAAEM